MGYKGKVTKKVLKDGKWTEVTEEINSRSEYEEEKWKSNSMMYSPFSKKEVQEEVINEQSPRELYYKENPSVKEKRNNLKYKTGRYFKENISKIDGV
ncbi:hypothetical protein J5751_03605 [bacterium]|nr:hypothetical protein [bacterium]